jgi:hypothetical protein
LASPIGASRACLEEDPARPDVRRCLHLHDRGVDAPSEKVDSAMGPQMYYSVLGIPNLLKLISEAGCICRHLEYDQYPELHLYVIAQRG